jgi:hypothetical protein
MKILLVIKLFYFCTDGQSYISEKTFSLNQYEQANRYYETLKDNIGSNREVRGEECQLMDVKAGHRKVK